MKKSILILTFGLLFVPFFNLNNAYAQFTIPSLPPFQNPVSLPGTNPDADRIISKIKQNLAGLTALLQD